MKTNKSPNRLSAKASFKLVTWIQCNLKQIQADGLGDKQVAERPGAALGFEVLGSNVRALRGQFGWKWGKAAGPARDPSFDALYAEFKGLRSDFDRLFEIVRDAIEAAASDPGTLPSLRNECRRLCTKLAEIDSMMPANGHAHTENQPLFQS